MTDPFSVGGGIAGLVTLADVVFIRLFKYVQAVKGANKEITALSCEVGALYGILSRLRLISEQLEFDGLDPATQIQHIHSCNKTLEKLNKILDKDSMSPTQAHRLETIRRKLHWPFTASEVKTLIAEIERHKATLGLALNADGMSGLLQSLSIQGTIRDDVQDIKFELRQKNEADTRIAINTKRQSLLKSFGKTDPSKNQKMGLRLRQQGTGMWLLESLEFQSWSQTANSKLWLHGIPGAGKTVLAATIIEEVLRTSSISHAVAFYYCDYKDPETQKPSSVLGSLVQQLAKQDEQCFDKVQSFCDQRNPDFKEDFEYDSQELQVLILSMAASFERVTLVVDGLDECGSNATAVTELLVGLHCDDNETDIATLFLSRGEVEIRDCLATYTQVAIAAQSSDLKLYVGAEIESRVRKNKLRIKDPSLKEYIMKQLVDGAEGMFRWAVCQMDYLCELPNDSARRKALSALPPTLNATYERILRRVNASNKDVQTLVSRALRWIIHQKSILSTAELCEAVSVNIGDSRRDLEAISDETDILRWCSSLVRKSADGDTIELAHFTVKEFLLQPIDENTGEFAVYRSRPGHDEIELAKVCVTYLNFQDFNQGVHLSLEAMETRTKEYPLLDYAARNWFTHAKDYLDNPVDELFTLVTQLLSPSKPNNLISWAQNYLINWSDANTPSDLMKTNRAVAESTALHYAAMLGLPEVCAWLIDRGCEVNRGSLLGTPLHCALIRYPGLLFLDDLDDAFDASDAHSVDPREESVISILLNAGADPNSPFSVSADSWSPIAMSLASCDLLSTIRILEKGGRLNERCLTLLEEIPDWVRKDNWGTDNICIIFRHINYEDLEAHPQLMSDYGPQLIGELGSLISRRRSNHKDKSNSLGKAVHGSSLRVAARFGQAEVISQLLGGHELDINGFEAEGGLTALHYAAMNDHLEALKILLSHGAQTSQADFHGKTVMHHATKSIGSHCLQFLLQDGIGSDSTDNDGLTVWHTAALDKSKHKIETLAKYLTREKPLSDLKDHDGWTPLLCAASSGSLENLAWLLNEGCTVTDTANDGSTALHHAAESHSVEAINFLLDKGSDIRAVTRNGSTVLHYALLDLTKRFGATVEVLVERGVDPCKAREDGMLPIHRLIPDEPYSNTHKNSFLKDFEIHEGKQALQAMVPRVIKASAGGLDLFNEICQLQSPSRSNWLHTVLEIFLAHGADLAITDTTGESALQSLTKVWLRCCSQPSRGPFSFSVTSTQMIHMVMKIVPLDGPLHDACTDPSLAKQAITTDDEVLAFRFLEHSPDMDMKIGDSSIIETACIRGCSSRLFKDLLERSAVSTENQQQSHLVQLCCKGNYPKSYDLVQVLLESGYSPNDVDPITGWSPIMSAASHGNVELMELLISKGAILDTIDKSGCNVAHHACAGGHQECLRILRNTEIEWNRTGKWIIRGLQLMGLTPLHLAASLSDSPTIEYLIDEGLATDINAVAERSITSLFVAAWSSLPLNVSALLKTNADPMIRTFGNETPLHVAIRIGYEAVLAVFLEHGCDVDAMTGSGLDCEMLARKYGHRDLAKTISEYKKQQGHMEDQKTVTLSTDSHTNKDRQKSEALRVAIDLVDIDLCKRIIEDGTDLSLGIDRCQGCRPLLYALHKTIVSQCPSLEIAETLVLQGASIEGSACSSWKTMGYTVFHYAARFGYIQFLRILFDKYPMMVFELKCPIHPIHLAILAGQYECVEMIIDHFREKGTSISLPCKASGKLTSVQNLLELQVAGLDIQHHWYWKPDPPFPSAFATATPLQIAANCGHVRITKLLLERGAAMDKVDNEYQTALHHAAKTGQTEIAEILLSSGANLHALTKRLQSAISLAALAGHSEILSLLMQRGADLKAQDWFGRTTFHFAAASSSVATMSVIMTAADGYDLGFEDLGGYSSMSIILAGGTRREISYLLSLAPDSAAYKPHTGNVLTAAVLNERFVSISLFKKLLKRIPPSLVKTLLEHRARSGGTPLYAACTQASPHRQEDVINTLLQAGADLEHKGGIHGTPLMGACAAGRLSAVKILVSKGAKISYERDGLVVSALNAAKHFPEIMRWILVEQYTKGPRRILSRDSS